MTAKTLIGATIVALAFSTGAIAGHHGGGEHRGHGERMHSMQGMHGMHGLDLTDEQRAQMREIHARYHPQMEQLRAQVHAEIEAILTPEQRAQLEERKAARAERMESRGEHHERRRGNRGDRPRS